MNEFMKLKLSVICADDGEDKGERLLSESSRSYMLTFRLKVMSHRSKLSKDY